MRDEAVAKARRLVESLERDAAGLASAAVSDDNARRCEIAEGQRVITAALAAARELLNALTTEQASTEQASNE